MLVQLVIAAMTTAPLDRSNESPLLRTATCLSGAPSTTFVNEDFALRSAHAILRALRSGDGRLDGGKIEFQLVAEQRIRRRVGAEQELFLAIGFDESDLFVRAAGELKIRERFGIDGKETHRRAVFGRHVGDRGAIGNAEAGKAGAVELDEFADDAFLAQHFGDGEDEIGGGRAFAEFAVQAEADDFGNQHRRRLAEHGGFRFDAADAPAEDAERVHHRGVRIGADDGVGIRLELVAAGHRADDAREIFEIDLMADAGVWRDDFEILKGGLAPAEKGVALDVALKFEFGVQAEGIGGCRSCRPARSGRSRARRGTAD